MLAKDKVSLWVTIGIMVVGLVVAFSPVHPRNKPPVVSPDMAIQPLSKKEYQQIEDKLTSLVVKQNPRVALDTLHQQMNTNPAVLLSCHALAHQIGHAALTTYRSFATAMEYQQEICNSGYMHGIIEQALAASPQPLELLQTLCSDYVEGSFQAWECYHGSGHGFMFYTDNDLPKSLIYCQMTTTVFQQKACETGVFMENFNTDQQLHPSKYLHPADPFYPCAKQKPSQKPDCYLYAPDYFMSLHPNDFNAVTQWCLTAEKDFQVYCFQGVGSLSMIHAIQHPAAAEQVCLQAQGVNRVSCIMGMTILYINHFGSAAKGSQLCTVLQPDNQPACQQAVKGEQQKFAK